MKELILEALLVALRHFRSLQVSQSSLLQQMQDDPRFDDYSEEEKLAVIRAITDAAEQNFDK